MHSRVSRPRGGLRAFSAALWTACDLRRTRNVHVRFASGPRWSYRPDVSVRYITLSRSGDLGGRHEQEERRARARRPRAAPPVADAWVRAPQADQHRARLLPRSLVRIAVPMPQGAPRPRLDRRGQHGRAHRDPPSRWPLQDRLPADGGGQGALGRVVLDDPASDEELLEAG